MSGAESPTVTPRQAAFMTRVEGEYCLPFWEVVKGYADANESATATARILGFSPSRFIALLEANGRREWFRADLRTNGRLSAYERNKGRYGDAHKRALAKAHATNPRFYWVTLNGVTDTLAGHARRRSIPLNTVYGRIKRGLSPEKALTPGSLHRPARPSASHPWKTD